MAAETTQVILTLEAGPEADDEDLETLTRQLRTELLELDLEAIDLARAGEMPVGAKAGEPIAWGTLLLTLAASGGVLTTLISQLPAWLNRQGQRSVTLEIEGDKLEVSGISAPEQQRLIDLWLSRQQDVGRTNEALQGASSERQPLKQQLESETPPDSFENIHLLLAETFTDEGLRCFCYDVPECVPVYKQLGPNTDKGNLIDQLIAYAHQKSQLRKLLALAKAYTAPRKD